VPAPDELWLALYRKRPRSFLRIGGTHQAGEQDVLECERVLHGHLLSALDLLFRCSHRQRPALADLVGDLDRPLQELLARHHM
jgi:hypothetical protein